MATVPNQSSPDFYGVPVYTVMIPNIAALPNVSVQTLPLGSAFMVNTEDDNSVYQFYLTDSTASPQPGDVISNTRAVIFRQFATSTAPTEPTVELVGDLTSLGGGDIKFRSMTLGPDSKLYAAPYSINKLLVFDPATDTADFSVDTSGESVATNKWVDATLASNGKIYCNPHGAPGGFLIIDPFTSPPTIDSAGYALQVRGSAQSGTKLYANRFSGGTMDSVVTLDLNTNAISSIPFIIDRTGPQYTIRTNWEAENSAYRYDRYWGLTKASNGKLYGAPYSADRVMIVNPATNTAVQSAQTVTGGHPIPTGPTALFDTDDYWNKYTGGTRSSVNGHIYIFPRYANTILKINTNDDTLVEIPLPTPLIPVGDFSKSFSSVEGPDGKIYSVPWSHPFLFWIDPRTDVIGYLDITDLLVNSSGSVDSLYYTYGATYGRSIYYAPGRATKVLKVTPN